MLAGEMPWRAVVVTFAVLAGCPGDDPGGTLDGSVCGLVFDGVDAVRGAAEVAVRYKNGTEVVLNLAVSDASSIVPGETVALRPPTGSISRPPDSSFCELPEPCDPAVGPTEITFSSFEDEDGGAVAGEFLACFADGTNAHGTFDTTLRVIR